MPRHDYLLANDPQYQCLFEARRILEYASRQVWRDVPGIKGDRAWEKVIDAKTHIELQMEAMRRGDRYDS